MKRLLLCLLCFALPTLLSAAERKLVMIAGPQSHPPMMHEFRAGSMLLQKRLQSVPGLKVELVTNGWPTKIVDGKRVDDNTCNPIWDADVKELPAHAITRGVKPFVTKDEWYFNMRFRDGKAGVKDIVVATPSDATRDGPYVSPKGPYPHIQAAKGRPETLAWAVERPDGGRGFGFTGGHFHANWQNDDQRRLVLNALVWLAKLDVTAGGIDSAPVSDEELKQNLDDKTPRMPKAPAPAAAPATTPAAK